MRKIFLYSFFILSLIIILTFGCSKTEEPKHPSTTSNPSLTITITITITVTITPTNIHTPTGNIVILDNFSDGNLYNNYNNYWYPYWPFDGQWVSTPTITTGYVDYGLRVTGHVTANAGFMPFFGYFGTTTNIDVVNGVDIRPVNYINMILKTIENVPVNNTGFFDKIRISLFTPNFSSTADYDITSLPSNSWQIYKINIDDFNFTAGSKDNLLSHMGIVGIYIFYTSIVQGEQAEAELYVDEVFFSEN
ncbi:MAG: hypothetical protein N3E50_03960 [Candidatus Goldbacteria bacterium]|nr:hypothetical protein [Candidatus Goldiibacteriota bacterium]